MSLLQRLDDVRWDYVSWFAIVHLGAAFGLLWYPFAGTIQVGPIDSEFHWATALIAAVLFLVCHLSITCGIHRFFTHAAFRAQAWLQWYWLVCFSGTFQAPAWWWVSKHHAHHRSDAPDVDEDSHDIKNGFWWAHMGWLLSKRATALRRTGYLSYLKEAPDPRRWVRLKWQQKHYTKLAVSVGLILPAALCSLWGDLLGGILIGAFSRLVLQYHGTWLVNSQSHCYGKQEFQSGSARGHKIIGLICNVGEGVRHDYHHAFPSDWRLEPTISAWNPGTWFLWVAKKFGWVWDLKEARLKQIERMRIRAT